MHLHLNKEV